MIKHYTLGDFGSRLRQRPDLTDELALAFDNLLSIINQVPDPREGTQSLLESGFFSCLASRVNSNVERLGQEANSDDDSDECFEDALDGLQLTTDHASAISGDSQDAI